MVNGCQIDTPLTTPVLFLVFNRLDTTEKVFQAIRKAKPQKLYIAADGPRESKAGESEKVEQVRDFITQHVDWACDVKTLFQEQNLGCKYAVSSAITWFFEHEPKGIILEDDCLPNQSFFTFCENLLNVYEYDMRIWQIGGNTFGFTPTEQSQSVIVEDYSFIKIPQIWGWATWRSRWKHYDPEISHIHYFDKHASSICADLELSNYEFQSMLSRFKKTITKEIDTWDYQWHATVILNQGLCIIPSHNLISNLGDGEDATHTAGDKTRSHLTTTELNFPLKKESHFFIDKNAQNFFKEKMNLKLTTVAKTKMFIKKHILHRQL